MSGSHKVAVRMELCACSVVQTVWRQSLTGLLAQVFWVLQLPGWNFGQNIYRVTMTVMSRIDVICSVEAALPERLSSHAVTS